MRAPPIGSRLDRSNPVNQGLLCRFVTNEESGYRLNNLANNSPAIGVSMSWSPDIPVAAAGIAPNPNLRGENLFPRFTTGSASHAYLESRVWGIANAYTIIVWETAAQDGQTQQLFSRDGTSRDWQFRRVNNNLEFIRFDSSNSVVTDIVSSFGADLGVRHGGMCAAVFNANSGSYIYFNGQLVGSDSVTTANGDRSNATITIGDRSKEIPNSGVWDGTIGNISYYNRALSQAEILYHYRNPYGGLIAPRRRSYFIPAAGFKGYWARQRSGIIGAGVR